MKICEDCIKKDVCKYRAKVEKYEEESKLPEPLVPNAGCKYRRTEPSNCTYTIWNGDETISCPGIYTDDKLWASTGTTVQVCN